MDDLLECMNYFRAYDDCLGRLSPGHPEVASARVASSRAAMQRLDLVSARRACADGATQLRTSWH